MSAGGILSDGKDKSMANKDHIFVLGKEAIASVMHMATSDPDTVKLVVRSTEKMKDAYVLK